MTECTPFSVLIIEDDAIACDVARKSLMRLGCRVTITHTAESGLDELKRQDFNVVIAGLCIRRMGGRSIARWIRSNKPATVCIILTSWQGELENAVLVNDGISSIIHKPLQFNEIRQKIGSLIPGVTEFLPEEI